MRHILNPKKRNLILIFLCFFAYTCSYLLKLGYNANIVCFEKEFSISHAEAGMVTTFFFFAYGSMQILHGIFVKKYPLRYVVPGAIVLGAILNLLAMTSPSFAAIKYYWLLDGAILSVLWPSVIRAISENVDNEYRNKAIVIMGLTTATGTILVYGMSALFVALGYFRGIFVTGIALGIAISLLWFFFYPVLKKETPPQEEKTEKTKGKRNSADFILLVICFSILCVISTFARDGISTWFPSILKENFNVSESYGILITILLAVGQFIGSYFAVLFSKIVKDRILLCGIVFSLSALFIGAYILFGEAALALCILFFAFSCLCFSAIVNITTSIVPLEWGKERNAGFYAALFNGFCYLGSTISSYGLGLVADEFGWKTSTIVIEISLIVAASIGLLAPLIKILTHKKRTSNPLEP